MKFQQIKRKVYDREYADTPGSKAITIFESRDSEPTVYHVGKLSTADKLHELYHHSVSERQPRGLEGWALEELSADEFSSLMRDKPGLSWNMIRTMIWRLKKKRVSNKRIYRVLLKSLRKMGYNMNYDQCESLKELIEAEVGGD